MSIKTWFKKPKKLNETTRLYALYGESSNLEYLDNVGKDNAQKIAQNAENIQSNTTKIQSNTTNIQSNRTNIQNNKNKIDSLENRINNLPQSDVNKAYVDRQDNALSDKIEDLRRTTPKLGGPGVEQTWTSYNIFDRLTHFGDTVDMNNHTIRNLATPTEGNHAANKEYVDNVGFSFSKGYNTLHPIKQPQYWTNGNLRTFKYHSKYINITIPRKVRRGNYYVIATWKILFENIRYRVTSFGYYSDIQPGYDIALDPESIGFFTIPTEYGVPQNQIYLEAIVAVQTK